MVGDGVNGHFCDNDKEEPTTLTLSVLATLWTRSAYKSSCYIRYTHFFESRTFLMFPVYTQGIKRLRSLSNLCML